MLNRKFEGATLYEIDYTPKGTKTMKTVSVWAKNRLDASNYMILNHIAEIRRGTDMRREGSIKVNSSIFHYWVKYYDEPSEEYGIDGGRISKAMLKRDGEIVYNYDRGLDIAPADGDTDIALAILLKDYN